MFACIIVGLLGLLYPGLFIVLPFLGFGLVITSLPFAMLGLEGSAAIIPGILVLISLVCYTFNDGR